MESTALFSKIAERLGPKATSKIIVKSREYQWTINRLVLTLSSGVLAQLCRESEDGTIDLSRHDPSLISKLLEFCRDTRGYSLDRFNYEDNRTPSINVWPALFHVRMAFLGQTFKMPTLSKAAARYLENRFLPQTFDIFEFCDTARKLYNWESRLTKILRECIAKKVCQETSLLKNDLVLKVIHESPRLAIDIINRSQDSIRNEVKKATKNFSGGQRHYICPSTPECEFTFIADLNKMITSTDQNIRSGALMSQTSIKCPGCARKFHPNIWEETANPFDPSSPLKALEWPFPPFQFKSFLDLTEKAYKSSRSPREIFAGQFVKDPLLMQVSECLRLMHSYPQLAIDVAQIAFDTLDSMLKIKKEDKQLSIVDYRTLRCPGSEGCGFEFDACVDELRCTDESGFVPCPACHKAFDRDTWRAKADEWDDEVWDSMERNKGILARSG